MVNLPPDLPPGLYERIVTERLRARLSALDARLVVRLLAMLHFTLWGPSEPHGNLAEGLHRIHEDGARSPRPSATR